MGGSFFGRLLQGLGLSGGTGNGGGASGIAASAGRTTFGSASAVTRHFAPLGHIRPPLPREIDRYVALGDNPSVLLTLQQTDIRQRWQRRPRTYPDQDRAGLFRRAGQWSAEQMRRLGDVLATLEPVTYGYGMFGTKKSPDWMRHVVTLWMGHDRKDQPIAVVQALADSGGLGVAGVMDILFCQDGAVYGSRNSLNRFAGVHGWLAAEAAAITAALPDTGADVRAEAVAAIGRFGLHGLYLEPLLDSAVSSAKKVRAAARQALTGADKDALATLIEARFAKAAPGQRAELVDVAATALGTGAQPLLERLREGETAPKVLAAFDRTAGATRVTAAASGQDGAVADGAPVQADGPDGYLAVDGRRVALPPMPDDAGQVPFDRDLLRLLQPVAEEFNAILRSGHAEPDADNRWHWTRSYSPVKGHELESIAKLAESSWPISSHQRSVAWLRFHKLGQAGVTRFFADPRLSPWHVVRLALGLTGGHMGQMAQDWGGPGVIAARARIEQGIDARLFVDLWAANGGKNIFVDYLSQRWAPALPDVGLPMWPALCSHWALLDEALGMVPKSRNEQLLPSHALDLLALFPILPERYRGRLMILAGDSSTHIRTPARALLRNAPGLGASIALLLGDGRQDVRAQAAQWLAQRQERDQIPALRAVLTKERSDVARAAIITALDQLGDDVSDLFDHAAMVKEAEAGLAKAKIKGLDWLAIDHLPALRWADGTAVDPLLPRWWVTLAVKLKQPGGNALIDLWLDRLAPGDAHRLGWMVLTAWIDEDTRCPTEEEANAYAAAHVDSQLQHNIDAVKRWPQGADYYITDRDRLFAQLKRQKAGEYQGSLADSKGVLALASRVSAIDAAPRVRAFLKDHGARVSQSKALLDMMASIGTSSALQVVLAAANRSKQRSVQTHAAALIDGVAQRNGWTAAELADRTIPTGGLDADTTLELDCGEGRGYRVQMDGNDNVILLNPDGKEVKALPAPRIDEEKPLIEAAKKLLTNARKEVKQVLAAQTERLQEAMVFERQWPREDWLSFVVGHPIVGRLASRLVWFGLDEKRDALASFRPLGDGSYSDAADNDVDIAAFVAIRLVHASQLDRAEIAAWRTHLADYAVVPPFDQINRDLPTLPDAMREDRAIKDREGWVIENFKLRGTATKQGYKRGPAGDGGWFMTYERAYREAGLVAEIEFTGSPLPEENIPTALLSLSFRRLGDSGRSGGQLALKDVPAVLLAESWQDLHDIAAKGSGHDADWKKKVQY